MANINGLGNNYIEEYKEFGSKIIAENEQILRKAGIQPKIFNQDSSLNNSMQGLEVEKTDTKDNKVTEEDKKDNETSNDKSFQETTISKNNTTSKVRASGGIFNTVYKTGIKSNTVTDSLEDNSSVEVEEFMSSLEETNGNDDNDDLEDFMATEYKDGLHLNGGGYVYYENGSTSLTESVNASLSGSYKSKNQKFSLSYGGAFEYENSTQKTGNNNEIKKDGCATLMGKYKTNKLTYAAGGSAFYYDNNTSMYNISAGAVLNDTGLAATLTRKILVARNDQGQKTVNNQTSFKVNIIKPKEAGDFPNVIPDIPSPSDMQQYDTLVNSEKQEVNALVSKKSESGLDVELSTSSDSDEYGLVYKHTFSYAKKQDKKEKNATLTPYIGAYDYHPNTQEGIKIRTGIEGNLDITTGSDITFHSTAIVDNKRIIQSGSRPLDTFMAVLDTTVNRKNLSASVSTGYISSGSDIKYSFITGKLNYQVKSSSISLVAGYQDCDLPAGSEKIFHTGMRYALTF